MFKASGFLLFRDWNDDLCRYLVLAYMHTRTTSYSIKQREDSNESMLWNTSFFRNRLIVWKLNSSYFNFKWKLFVWTILGSLEFFNFPIGETKKFLEIPMIFLPCISFNWTFFLLKTISKLTSVSSKNKAKKEGKLQPNFSIHSN